MQVILLLLVLLSSTYGRADFSTKVNIHASAVATTKAQVRRVGDAQLKFQELMASCAPKNIATQEVLLTCGQKFLQLHLEFRTLKTTQAEAEQAVAALPPEFSTAASALKKTLQESLRILNLVTDTPEKTAKSLFAMNAVYVQKQFEREYQDAFAKGRIQAYCSTLQSEIDTLAKLAQLAVANKLAFPILYRQNLRLRNTLLLAKEISPVCKQNYNVTPLNTGIKELSAGLTPSQFSSYKKAVCKKPNPKSGLTTQACERLPLTPYSIHWLELAGVSK